MPSPARRTRRWTLATSSAWLLLTALPALADDLPLPPEPPNCVAGSTGTAPYVGLTTLDGSTYCLYRIVSNLYEPAPPEGWDQHVGTFDLVTATFPSVIIGPGWPFPPNYPHVVLQHTPRREGHYRARFYLDPNSFSMKPSKRLTIFGATSRDPVGKAFKLLLRRKDGAYQVLLQAPQPPDAAAKTAWLDVPDGPAAIEIEWLRARSASAHDGLARIWIDGTQVAELLGLGNGALAVDDVKLGAPAGTNGTMSGTLYVDHFEARRHTYIGP